ncbi:putative HTH-type transcriptional regulator YurK [Corynebacterium occultum]|uniref:Putative HTH-type transcriptional regulator YurK n=1 Tax=Corynebacterium occultum TaxID=2675219 RepID=A0A6B8WD91_9CORY|nr:GntR family transcriptional regulator [Corynebacterium occultum]QGU07960.1 putative HTH-type transcriptional regulator YurK [Corynebacterium occultum]
MTNSSSVQQHEHIAHYLRSAIKEGTFSTGDPLPTEAELSRRFETSRGPVRQAMSTLRAEGLISSGRGRRSVVLDKVSTQSFDDVISFSQWCRKSGIQPGQKTQWVARRKAEAALAAQLEISDCDPVVSVYRLRLMDGAPAMVERLNYPLSVGRHVLAFDTDAGSIYQELIDNGVDINHATRTIDAVGADQEDADLLEVPVGTPLLRVRRRAFTLEGTPVEYSDDRYLPWKASFTMNSTREHPNALSMVSDASYVN